MGDFLAFPYGKSQPTLTCAPLRTCLIRLQAGETVLGAPALGDSERWLVGLLTTGPNGNTPLVYVKPTDCDITTNLVISTDRHLYNVMLDSPPCPKGSTNNITEPYTWHLTFYYPDEAAQQWAAHAAIRANEIALAPATTGMSPDQLNFAYDVKKDRKFPWKPEHVFDDGVHLYIKRPASAAQAPAPVLFGLSDDGTRVMLNYTLRHDYYITDRLVDRAVFIVVDGNTERKLTLIKTGGAHS
jgi:type IV secretion system protein VirB9